MFFLSFILAYLFVFVLAFFSPNRESDKREEIKKIHAQSLQDLCHTKKETSFLPTNGNSKTSKEESMSSFVKISHLYGTSY